MLLLFGAFLMSGSLWIILNLGVVMLYYYKAAVREEQELSVLFADYESYVEKTGRFFPRLHDR
jgi:protein-S-isoprenylcysteine O-methyltransferase Ste14